MLQLLRFTIGNGGIKQCQMHHYVGILVNDIHKHVTNSQRHSKFFSTLADKRLFFRFSRLDLATNELPKKTSCLVCRALADHEFIAIPYKGCYYFGHTNSLFGQPKIIL